MAGVCVVNDLGEVASIKVLTAGGAVFEILAFVPDDAVNPLTNSHIR